VLFYLKDMLMFNVQLCWLFSGVFVMFLNIVVSLSWRVALVLRLWAL